ncbi:MAG: hypothetical protein ACP5FH_00540, partial [Terracidiphilus sp.]
MRAVWSAMGQGGIFPPSPELLFLAGKWIFPAGVFEPLRGLSLHREKCEMLGLWKASLVRFGN